MAGFAAGRVLASEKAIDNSVGERDQSRCARVVLGKDRCHADYRQRALALAGVQMTVRARDRAPCERRRLAWGIGENLKAHRICFASGEVSSVGSSSGFRGTCHAATIVADEGTSGCPDRFARPQEDAASAAAPVKAMKRTVRAIEFRHTPAISDWPSGISHEPWESHS